MILSKEAIAVILSTEKREKIYMPKTSKLQFISSTELQKASAAAPLREATTQPGPEAEAKAKAAKSGIRFVDDEYPELELAKKKGDLTRW